MDGLIRKSLWPIVMIALVSVSIAEVNARPLSLLPKDAVFIDDPEAPGLSKRSQTAAAAALAAVQAGSASEGLARLHDIESPLEFEQASAEVIGKIQAGGDSQEARLVLLGLSEVPIRVFTRHEETSADWFVPVFNIAERARSALQVFDRQQDIDAWRVRLAEDPVAAVASLAENNELAETAAAAAAQLPQAEATRLGEHLLTTQPNPAASRVARELALKTAELRWFDYVRRGGVVTDQLALVAQTERLGREEATSWLVAVSLRHDTGSAALIALSHYADAGSVGFERLIDALDDQRLGPSAAAALAARPQADRMAVLAELTRRDDLSSRALGRVALALRIEGSPAAKRLLIELSRRPDLPGSVREELSR